MDSKLFSNLSIMLDPSQTPDISDHCLTFAVPVVTIVGNAFSQRAMWHAATTEAELLQAFDAILDAPTATALSVSEVNSLARQKKAERCPFWTERVAEAFVAMLQELGKGRWRKGRRAGFDGNGRWRGSMAGLDVPFPVRKTCTLKARSLEGPNPRTGSSMPEIAGTMTFEVTDINTMHVTWDFTGVKPGRYCFNCLGCFPEGIRTETDTMKGETVDKGLGPDGSPGAYTMSDMIERADGELELVLIYVGDDGEIDNVASGMVLYDKAGVGAEEAAGVNEEGVREFSEFDLIPNGSNVDVTNANRHQYVNLMARHKMESSITDQLAALVGGCRSVYSFDTMSVFLEKDLDVLLNGEVRRGEEREPAVPVVCL